MKSKNQQFISVGQKKKKTNFKFAQAFSYKKILISNL